jgi:hypothetical protein
MKSAQSIAASASLPLNNLLAGGSVSTGFRAQLGGDATAEEWSGQG